MLRRGFCESCGSSLVGIYEGYSNVIISIGSLDHPEEWSVEQEGWFSHTYVADKIPWEKISDALTQHEKNFPGGAVENWTQSETSHPQT